MNAEQLELIPKKEVLEFALMTDGRSFFSGTINTPFYWKDFTLANRYSTSELANKVRVRLEVPTKVVPVRDGKPIIRHLPSYRRKKKVE
jgi:hypothetical protein